jgi:hypothetical protein
MKKTIEIPIEEYNRMKEELNLLKDEAFMEKFNKLIQFLLKDRHEFYLGDSTEDLLKSSIDQYFEKGESKWDEV